MGVATCRYVATNPSNQEPLSRPVYGIHLLLGFLLFRVLKTGSDSRFDDIRSHFFKFLGFWVGQIIWVWTVSLPVTILNSPGVVSSSIQHSFGTGTDIAGVVLWTVGWIVESVADLQKVN